MHCHTAIIDWWVALCIHHHECRHRGTILSFNTGQIFVIIHVAPAFLIVKKSCIFFASLKHSPRQKHTVVPLAPACTLTDRIGGSSTNTDNSDIIPNEVRLLMYNKFQCHGTQTCQFNSPKYNSPNRG